MATPAEIIAARVNGTYAEPEPPRPESRAAAGKTSQSGKSLSDKSAFPVLGGGASSQTSQSVSTSWGPKSNGNAATTGTPVLSAPASETPKAPKFKTSTVQEAFSLDAEDQLNVARPEFVKILTGIKTATGASIECTISQHTKKRTFLISGKPEQVKQAKRLVIRKLTKPISVTFPIPAKVRAKVIGAGGRTLKPIIAQTETKIDIGKVSEDGDFGGEADADDVFAQTVQVLLEGDADGCKQAKQLILAIVSEETKNMQIKVPVAEQMRPFAAAALQSVESKYAADGSDGGLVFVTPSANAGRHVIISGDRALALEAREDVRVSLAQFEKDLASVQVATPPAQHQLVPVEEILAKHRVVVQPSGDYVQYTGQKADIAAAQRTAAAAISAHAVEVLDMSKAHKGNLAHVRAVAAMFTKYGIFSAIAEDHGVKINAPDLAVAPDAPSLPVEIIVKTDDVETAKKTRRAIVAAVNGVTPDQTREITDLDKFFSSQITAALDAVPGAKHIFLDDKLILFDYAEAEAEADDFAETSVLEDCIKALGPVYELQKRYTCVVLDAPAASQKHIEGPNGSTLRTILAQVPEGSVEVRMDRSGHVYVQGLSSEVEKVRAEMSEIIAEASEYSSAGGYSTTLEVPTSVLSRVIGKGGSGLAGVREQYGVEVDVARDGARDNARDDPSARTSVTIRGIRRNAEGAKTALQALATKLADETLVRLRIDNKYHHRIIGPHFTYINRLQDRYNVKIRFPSEMRANHSDAPHNEHEVTIRGPSKAVARAEHELKQLYEYEQENGLERNVQVPTKAISRVLGKDFNNIMDVAAATGVEYKVLGERKADVVEIQLTGSRAALTEAEKRIQNTVSEVQNTVTQTLNVNPKYIRDLVGPSGSVMRAMISKAGGDHLSRAQYRRLITTPDEGSNSGEVVFEGDRTIVASLVAQVEALVAQKDASVDEKLHVPREKHRLLIGPGGSVRAALEEEFSVRLSIPSQNSTSADVLLSGLPAQIELLKAKIAEITKDEWNEEVLVPAALFSVVSARGSLFKTLRDEYGVDVRHGNRASEAQSLNKKALPTAPDGSGSGEPLEFITRPLDCSAGGEKKPIPCRFIGSAEATAKAAKIVQDYVQAAEAATTEAWAIVKEQKRVPRIVGPLGSRISHIRSASGAFITVPRASEKDANVVYLVGTAETLAKAQAELAAAIKA